MKITGSIHEVILGKTNIRKIPIEAPGYNPRGLIVYILGKSSTEKLARMFVSILLGIPAGIPGKNLRENPKGILIYIVDEISGGFFGGTSGGTSAK